jgi:hypothetical protein
MTPEQLVEIPGIGEKMVEKIHQSVAAYFEALESQATEPAAEVAEEVPAAEANPAEPQTEAAAEAETLAPTADSDAGDESAAELKESYERDETVSEGSETPVATDLSQAERLETEEAPAKEQNEEQQ